MLSLIKNHPKLNIRSSRTLTILKDSVNAKLTTKIDRYSLQLLAFTANKKIHADLAEAAHEYNKNINPRSLLTQGLQLHSLMHNYNLTYNNAKRFLAGQKRLGLFPQLKPIVIHENQEETLQFKPR